MHSNKNSYFTKILVLKFNITSIGTAQYEFSFTTIQIMK